ncbi:hypothetical protein GO308_12720 [Sphingomonas sp. SFZ2018-12]|uniref:hypothetical protein n=1 Tax=Sphingomonas sp. SFZ2018-12 TaxID=2683197 RepID=UPI001F10AE51|nr:hypothetical protein [Sphingomonas sp. SFZ2018-12]MCH4893978.1 hypothetical protein [Sphingomonas sp. SFZ2018-12]
MQHDIITADPDIAQAIEDLRAVGAALRRNSALLLTLPEGSVEHRAERALVLELQSRIDLRAGRLGISGAALTELINDDLNDRARRGRGKPSRPTSRTLMDAVMNAQAREADAHRALSAAQIEVKAATEARRAAEEAYRVYAQGRQA